MTTLLAATVALLVGYALGASRLLMTVTDWLDVHDTARVTSWRWWVITPLMVAHLVWIVVRHPRRVFGWPRRRAIVDVPLPAADPINQPAPEGTR